MMVTVLLRSLKNIPQRTTVFIYYLPYHVHIFFKHVILLLPALCCCFVEIHTKHQTDNMPYKTQHRADCCSSHISMFSVIILLLSTCWPVSRVCPRCVLCLCLPTTCLYDLWAELQTTQAHIRHKWSKRERRQWDQRQRERGCHPFKSAETKGRGDCGSSCQFQYTAYLFQAGERCHSQDVLGSHVLSCHCQMRQYSTLLH